ncbi:hypothetical protein BP5796_04048 [Coleophoma crateriformis]|uniref:Uncharacterized protein n=1 Tax=Coleophoma crateriformis TaxID=565419 RepID=A0A3D8SHE4_9HELO|nr:hypothetical protein BP5796_04048 [Coleophoma crateriformis]
MDRKGAHPVGGAVQHPHRGGGAAWLPAADAADYAELVCAHAAVPVAGAGGAHPGAGCFLHGVLGGGAEHDR